MYATSVLVKVPRPGRFAFHKLTESYGMVKESVAVPPRSLSAVAPRSAVPSKMCVPAAGGTQTWYSPPQFLSPASMYGGADSKSPLTPSRLNATPPTTGGEVFARTLSLAGRAVRAVARRHHAVLLANHGPVVGGKSLEAACDAIEELEATARLFLLVRHEPEAVRVLTPIQVADLQRRYPR